MERKDKTRLYHVAKHLAKWGLLHSPHFSARIYLNSPFSGRDFKSPFPGCPPCIMPLTWLHTGGDGGCRSPGNRKAALSR